MVATEYERVAEFRLAASGAVELILGEPDGCPLARQWFEQGIRIPGRVEPAIAADGSAFLEAALRPRRMSYCRVVDESPGTAHTPSIDPTAGMRHYGEHQPIDHE
ncbi:hypothetical protein [Nocardia sp. NPDC003963]